MTIREIRAKAQAMKVPNYSRMTKAELVRAIQSKEGNQPCFQSIQDCRQHDCLWMADCQ